MFEMLPGYHTQNFVGEIFRLTESSHTDEKCFKWLDTYTQGNLLKKIITSTNKVYLRLKIQIKLHYNQPYFKTIAVAVNDKRLDTVSSKLDSLGLAPPSSASAMKSSGSMNSLGAKSSENVNNDSPDSSLNRQDIAMGAMSPIAARESVVRYQMSMKEQEFTEIQSFSVYCATWNVNGQSPNGSVRLWLSQCDEPPDLYAIGFQELDLSKEAFLFTDSDREVEWVAVIDTSLHPKAKYVRYFYSFQ